MSVVRMSEACDGARAQISRRLDGEISQLEERMLEQHLARCADCRTFDAQVTKFTRSLRDAPLEPLAFPIEIRRTRRTALARAQVGIAAAVAIAVIGSVLQIALPGASSSSQAFRSPDRFPTSRQVQREVKQIIADGRAFDQHKQGGTVIPM
jgi:predicted anti-sigma-YlaC factor YlaD